MLGQTTGTISALHHKRPAGMLAIKQRVSLLLSHIIVPFLGWSVVATSTSCHGLLGPNHSKHPGVASTFSQDVVKFVAAHQLTERCGSSIRYFAQASS